MSVTVLGSWNGHPHGLDCRLHEHPFVVVTILFLFKEVKSYVVEVNDFSYSGFYSIWTPVNVDSCLMWTFYQEWNDFLYYVFYNTSLNMDNYLVTLDNPNPKHMQQGQLVQICS